MSQLARFSDHSFPSSHSSPGRGVKEYKMVIMAAHFKGLPLWDVFDCIDVTTILTL